MNPRTKAILLTLLTGVTVFLIFIFIKANYFEVTLDSIVSNKNYKITEIEKNVTMSFFVGPELISNNNTKGNNKVFEINEHQILLDSVIDRNSDIYFSFHTNLKLSKKKGSFIHPGVLGSNRLFSTPTEEIKLFTTDNEIIKMTQVGFGPSSDFSFGIEKSEEDTIMNGFIVQFNGFSHYNYNLK